jgi:hypothetical protein
VVRKGPLTLETLTDRGEDRHLPVCPFDAGQAGRSEGKVEDIVLRGGHGHGGSV